VMSYCGHMDFGIVADRDQMPDVWCLIDWIEAELEQLRPKGRSRRARSARSAQRTRDAE
jgi:diacylglycerol O-acyltransferase / wax synthase